MTGMKFAVIVLALVVVALLVSCTEVTATEGELDAVVIGRTGETLHISVPYPIERGTLFKIREIISEPPIAEAVTLECTSERPYVASAIVTKADIAKTIAIGTHAFAEARKVSGPNVPSPLYGNDGNSKRFSIQAGVFQPESAALKQDVAENWESYRLNYSFLKHNNFEAQISTGYDRGTSEPDSWTGLRERSVEVIPAVIMGRIKPISFGSAKLVLGAGGGIYRIKTSERMFDSTSSESVDKKGYELSAGLESKRGWNLELRFRDVGETDIRGYSLTLGTRF